MEMKSDGCDHFPLNLRVDDSRLINYVRQSSSFLLEIVSLLINLEYSIYIFMKNSPYNSIISFSSFKITFFRKIPYSINLSTDFKYSLTRNFKKYSSQ